MHAPLLLQKGCGCQACCTGARARAGAGAGAGAGAASPLPPVPVVVRVVVTFLLSPINWPKRVVSVSVSVSRPPELPPVNRAGHTRATHVTCVA